MRLAFWRAPFMYRPCLITTKSDPESAFRGVLWESRGSWLVLRNCSLVKAGAPPIPIDGEVVIHLENFAFAQVEPAP